MAGAQLLIFTKPARPGEVKTRLIGRSEPAKSAKIRDGLTPEQAAELHQAFLDDLTERMLGGAFDLTLAWALAPGEPTPGGAIRSVRQRGADLGERLFWALEAASQTHEFVGVVGSDHPELPLGAVEQAFDLLRSGVEVVLGPASDGGYYFVGVRASSLRREVFEGIEWSTSEVLRATLDRCRAQSLVVELLEPGSDVDTPADLTRLARRLEASPSGALEAAACPRTERLLRAWGFFGIPGQAEGVGLSEGASG